MRTRYLLEKEMEHVLALLTPTNRLIMRVMLHTGMRVGDVVSLRPSDLKPSGWYTEQKTGKRRRYGFPRPLLDALRDQSGTQWVFEGRLDSAKHRTRQAVWADLRRAQVALRLSPGIGTHSARKGYAVALMRRYGDIERVRRNLGHSDVAVTAVYAMADQLLRTRVRSP